MEENITHIVTQLVFQIAIILVVAKVFGEVTERFLKQPSVLGELLGGIVIGPFALGGLSLGELGPLFPLPSHGGEGGVPVSNELYAVSQIAAVVLLFVAGLETDLQAFLRFAPRATLVAVGGIVFPFAFGVYATVLTGFATGPQDPAALFMGAIMTATSVGITARVLSDLRHLDSPEGVTVLAAAVVDDVLGILVLAIVVGISVTGSVEWSDVAVVGGKALGFWVVLTGGGILLSRIIARGISSFRVPGASVALALAVAFLAAALAEAFGLAMIIGAYSIGLALSNTDLAHRLEEPLSAVYSALVPVFFVVMGMLVDIPAMGEALALGLLITVLAIIGKVVGSGVPAYAAGFTGMGSWRVGVGMLPRGEVALIVAGIGLARGVIEADLFGVSIMMTVVTTFLAPIFLVPAFRNGKPGLRSQSAATASAE